MVEDIIAPLFTTRWGQRCGRGAVLVLSLFLIYLLITTLITWRADFLILHGQQPITQTAAKDDMTKWIASIPQQHIFGAPGQMEQQKVLPVTSLQLRLMGVIKADPEKFSRVIISEGGKPGKVYGIGDTLPASGVRINAITPDGVILENGGRLEKLPLARQPLQFQGMPKPLLNDEQSQVEE